ncbi:MAG TPA: ABC transporter permease [Humisphaera sp.]|jgi:ABC-2 type transport system permease protein|nr:ABC transporter permease [Humisphaera sp.]
MPGLLTHLWLTLKLNFRSKQAIVYGYVVPIFFLYAFGSVFKSDKTLIHEMGQLLTVTVLGGACFGMPTAMVNERERGVWRRYRLLPTAVGGIILSSMVARFVIVASAALIQIFLSHWSYQTPWPAYPGQLAIAFVFVTFAFLGLGLVIAMLADTVPAVQALGQALFLPMIMIGGVGVPLNILPNWARHVAGYFPGEYAVEALQNCYSPHGGLSAATFSLLALTIIGLAACITGAKIFRWDVGQRVAPRGRPWVAVALLAWAAVGLAAEHTGRLKSVTKPQSNDLVAALTGNSGSTQPSSVPAKGKPLASQPTTVATTEPAASQPAHLINSWRDVTLDDLNSITYEDVPDDGGAVTPFNASLENLDKDIKDRLDDLGTALLDWKPGQVADVGQRVRNILCVCAIPDVAQDLVESYVPLVVFDHLKSDIQKDELMKALGYVILKPADGKVITNIKELGFDADIAEEAVRERSYLYAKKMLFRLLGKKVA